MHPYHGSSLEVLCPSPKFVLLDFRIYVNRFFLDIVGFNERSCYYKRQLEIKRDVLLLVEDASHGPDSE